MTEKDFFKIFILVRLRTANFQKEVYDKASNQYDEKLPWVIMFCVDEDFKCPDNRNRHLLASMMVGIVNLGYMDCAANKKLCKEHIIDDENYGTFYYQSVKQIKNHDGKKLSSSDYKDLSEEILELLPKVKVLDEEKYSKIRLRLEDKLGPAWLIHFVFGNDGETIDDKKIPSMIPGVEFGKVDCKEQPKTCKELKVSKPTYICFKMGGAYETHYGRELPIDVAEFARKSAQARNMATLVTSDFPEIIQTKGVFVDFFAPWCPPCLNLLPEYRKASINVGGSIIFGTVDCTTQGNEI